MRLRWSHGHQPQLHPRAHRFCDRILPVGKLIPVFYDPDQPSRSVLEPAPRSSSWVMPIFGGLLLTGGLLMSRWFISAWRAENRRIRSRH